MKKQRKSPKKHKLKNKWIKQSGDFLFKRIIQTTSSVLRVDVYFKSEFIGFACFSEPMRKESYNASIYEINKSHTDECGVSIGNVECCGFHRGLPKIINQVTLFPNSALFSHKKVLTEKCKNFNIIRLWPIEL